MRAHPSSSSRTHRVSDIIAHISRSFALFARALRRDRRRRGHVARESDVSSTDSSTVVQMFFFESFRAEGAKVITFNVLHARGADDVGVDIADVDGIDVVVRAGDVDGGDGGEDEGP